jgi:tetratricopeptide (TPR) repeat protein|nr:tetratricopeptide repeat protein [Kofleriaceae bacterium]
MRRFLFAAILAIAVPPATVVHADDWEVQRNPFDPKVIGQYKAILARAPHDNNAFAKLLELYSRYSSRDNLKKEYQAQIDKKADDWPSLVVLGRLMHATGDDVRALDLWTKAVAAKDDDPETWLDIGELQKQAGKNADARPAYDKALAHAKDNETKKKALRALADIAMATGDNDGADAYFKQFLGLDPSNGQLWMEYGDAMLQAGKRDVALDAYGHAERLYAGDPTRRIDAVNRRGQALEAMGKDDEAVAEYRRAIKLAPKGYYIETELTNRIIDIYRRKQQLAVLLTDYEKEWPEGSRGHFEWDTLGKLYEETGAQDKAIHALQEAVRVDPTQVDTQRRLIGLLENSGRDDEALAQYEKVVQVIPGQAQFQLELADRYWRRGNEKKALDTLKHCEERFPNDPSVLGAIADFYTKWNKDELAIAEYEHLARVEPDEPGHLVALGDQYWQKGDKAKAIATWRRMTQSNKAASWAKLGEVLYEHGTPGQQPVEALAAYDKAVALDPKNPEFYKGRGTVYQTMKKPAQALTDYEQVLALIDNKPINRVARREARKRIVALVSDKWPQKEIEYRTKWRAAFDKSPADAESGYFLVEYYGKHPTLSKDEPTKSLEKLVSLVPDDTDLVIDLVELYKRAGRYDDAVAKLLELAKAQPSRERDVYTRIAEIKTLERKDKEAVEWQQKALAKNPTDPSAYEHLAENYVQMQQFANAIEAYEQVIKLDPRNSKAYFALAQLDVQGGKTKEAAELLRTLLRTANDEEIIGRAGRQAIDLEEMTDTLGELEKVIAPLSFMMSHKPVYRRVLVDLYLRYVPRLVERERHGTDDIKKSVRVELDRIGAHGLRPLLEALRDEKDANQQRAAVKVLGHLGNKGAAAPLVHLARQEPPKDQRRIGTLTESVEREVRVEALIAAGRLGDPSVLADVMPLVDNPEKAMREAATFTLGRSGDKRAVAPLVKALGDHQASVQIIACLGLAQLDDPRVGPALVSVLADATRSDLARAACAYGIGVRKYAAGTPALLGALDDNRGEAQRLAAWALGQLGEQKALGPLIRAYFARAGQSSDELVWAIGRATAGSGVAAASPADLGDYPLRGGKYDERVAIGDLPGTLPVATASAKLVADHAADIAAGLEEALGEHRDVVISVLEDLDGQPTAIALGALTPGNASDPKVAAAMDKIAAGIAPAVAAQLTSDDPKVRALALSVGAKLDSASAPAHDIDAAIAKALDDKTDLVRFAAMDAISIVAARRGHAPPELVAALSKALAAASWEDRRAAAYAIGRLGAAADVPALTKAAADPWSFVREAVATALGQSGQAAARAPLDQLVKDAVPQVRAAATAALAKLH